MKSTTTFVLFLLFIAPLSFAERYNVLFIISDDLTATALSCYGNNVCKTPNIDKLAEAGTRFTRAYCQGTYCGPSRASFMSGYYPHATGVLGYRSPRPNIGDRATWAQHFKNAGYYSARVSKIFHMGVPGGIEKGTDGADDPASWTERFNSKGPEWRAPGIGETLEGNPDGKRPVVGGNTFVVVEADGDDLVHSDGKTAAKACELIEKHKNETFFLGVGFVRPHVPFVSPKPYYEPFTYDEMVLPEKVKGDWDDIPKAGINYKTSKNMKMDIRRQKKAVGGYYASVAYMDAQVGKVTAALKKAGLEEKTIVIFTSDHGYHLGEKQRWSKFSLWERTTRVPLIISVPSGLKRRSGKPVELLSIYPTLIDLCGLSSNPKLEGVTLRPLIQSPDASWEHVAISTLGQNNHAVRDERWRYIRYADGSEELYDHQVDPNEWNNLAANRLDPGHAKVINLLKKHLPSTNVPQKSK